MEKNRAEYKFFNHRNCEYFPCHKGVAPEKFNCMFCYCPLYVLGEKCGGNYSITEKGYKDCSACTIPHQKESYDSIVGRYEELVDLMGRHSSIDSAV